jgi:hypothetical protein
VVETYRDDVMAHPVGTGPYRLKSWRRSSRIVLERNPLYRDLRYHSEPDPGDVEATAWAKRLNGRRLPLNDGVEIAVVQENQPRWLSFLNGQADFARVPPELSPIAAPNGKIAPNLAKQGIRLQRYLNPDVALSYFNMEDPVVGGYTPAKVRLRRAFSSRTTSTTRSGSSGAARRSGAGADGAGNLRLRSGAAHDNSSYDVAARRRCSTSTATSTANGDGWREQPDGSPLVHHDVERAGPDLPPVQRELAAQHDGDRRRMVFETRSGPST